MRAAFPENQRQVEESPGDEARVQRYAVGNSVSDAAAVVIAAAVCPCRRERREKVWSLTEMKFEVLTLFFCCKRRGV